MDTYVDKRALFSGGPGPKGGCSSDRSQGVALTERVTNQGVAEIRPSPSTGEWSLRGRASLLAAGAMVMEGS